MKRFSWSDENFKEKKQDEVKVCWDEFIFEVLSWVW
jgi:hypothetical protein